MKKLKHISVPIAAVAQLEHSSGIYSRYFNFAVYLKNWTRLNAGKYGAGDIPSVISRAQKKHTKKALLITVGRPWRPVFYFHPGLMQAKCY